MNRYLFKRNVKKKRLPGSADKVLKMAVFF